VEGTIEAAITSPITVIKAKTGIGSKAMFRFRRKNLALGLIPGTCKKYQWKNKLHVRAMVTSRFPVVVRAYHHPRFTQ
jgi:hypothetical protein